MEITDWIIGALVLFGIAGTIMALVDWVRNSRTRIRNAKYGIKIHWSNHLANVLFLGLITTVTLIFGWAFWICLVEFQEPLLAAGSGGLDSIGEAGVFVFGVLFLGAEAILTAFSNPQFLIVIGILLILKAIYSQRSQQ